MVTADVIMMSGRMRRLAKTLALPAACAVALLTAACGTQHISVAKSDPSVYHGAVLFSQRCAGCHTLYAAGTHGSAPNIRTAQGNSGPNFNVRCERPIDRVLYAIENGGFSGAYMPQNIVVGQDAVDVAKFVATYAGAKAPEVIGLVKCESRSVGTLPAGTDGQATAGASSGSASSTVLKVPQASTTLASVNRSRAGAKGAKKSAHS